MPARPAPALSRESDGYINLFVGDLAMQSVTVLRICLRIPRQTVLSLPVVLLLGALVVAAPNVSAQDFCFGPATNYTISQYPASVFPADFDGDADIDLVVANDITFGLNVSVFLNSGYGTFAPNVHYTSDPRGGSKLPRVVSADLDGDVDNDLAVNSYAGDNVWVLKNNSNGTFAPAVGYAAGNGPQSLCVADLDGDGDKDVIVGVYYDNNISVLMNNGDGTFALPTSFMLGTGVSPFAVFAGDLDADGDADLVSADILTDDVAVLMNNGNGAFAPTVNYPAGDGPYSVTGVDMDGDGDQVLQWPMASVAGSLC